MVGARPNRGECKDLLQASMQGLIDRIRDVQFMGRGFYNVDLDTIESVGTERRLYISANDCLLGIA